MSGIGATDTDGRPVQFNHAVMRAMSDEERVEAHRAGHFEDLLASRSPDADEAPSAEPAPATPGEADQGARGGNLPAQLGRDDLSTLTPAQIVQARRDGRLTDLLAGTSRR